MAGFPEDWAPPLEHVILEGADGSRCWITLHGAQVVRWTGPAGDEPPAAIRGGIPICWPQFNDRGGLAKHGFARNRPWTVEEVGVSSRGGSDRKHRVVLKLCADDGTRGADGYAASFTALLSIQLLGAAGELRMELTVSNDGDGEMQFALAFHTYFAIGNIRECAVRGLKGSSMINCVKKTESPGKRPVIPKPAASRAKASVGGERAAVDDKEELRFVYETDRIYTDVQQLVTLADDRNKRVFVIERNNLPGARRRPRRWRWEDEG